MNSCYNPVEKKKKKSKINTSCSIISTYLCLEQKTHLNKDSMTDFIRRNIIVENLILLPHPHITLMQRILDFRLQSKKKLSPTKNKRKSEFCSKRWIQTNKTCIPFVFLSAITIKCHLIIALHCRIAQLPVYTFSPRQSACFLINDINQRLFSKLKKKQQQNNSSKS